MCQSFQFQKIVEHISADYSLSYCFQFFLSQEKRLKQFKNCGSNHFSKKSLDGNINQQEKPGGYCSFIKKEAFSFYKDDFLHTPVSRCIKI